jgi:hypothetical protein
MRLVYRIAVALTVLAFAIPGISTVAGAVHLHEGAAPTTVQLAETDWP